MHKIHNPEAAPKPISAYSQGIEVSPQARWLYIAGQVGVTKDGRIGRDVAEQAEITWNNIRAVLAAAGMDLGDLVKISGFVTDTAHIADYRKVRDRMQGPARPASTLVVVAALASPDWLVEIEAIAARA